MISIPPNKVLHTKVQYLPSVREAKSHNFHFYNSTVSLGAVPEVRIMLLECYSSTKYLNLVDPLEYCPVVYKLRLAHCLQKCARKEISRPSFLDINM
jgi:hypothetical protein